MGLLLAILLGALVGYIAAKIGGRPAGFLGSLVVGVIGSFLGGLVSRLLGVGDQAGLNWDLSNLLWSLLGAVLFVAMLNALDRNRGL